MGAAGLNSSLDMIAEKQSELSCTVTTVPGPDTAFLNEWGG